MKSQLTALFLLYTWYAHTQDLSGGLFSSLGPISSINNDASAVFNNQAGIIDLEEVSLIGGVGQRYFWSDIRLVGLGLIIPSASGHFAFSMQRLGITEFQQQKLGLAYARRLWSSICISGQLDYFRTAIETYGNASTLSLEIGLQAQLSESLIIGTHIAHPYQPSHQDQQILAVEFTLGLGYEVSRKTLVGMEIEKQMDFPPGFKCVIKYQPKEKIKFLPGFSTSPVQVHFGVGIPYTKQATFFISNRYDLSLGLTSSFSFQYSFRRKQ